MKKNFTGENAGNSEEFKTFGFGPAPDLNSLMKNVLVRRLDSYNSVTKSFIISEKI